MKAMIRCTVALTIAAMLMQPAAWAQKKDEERTRGLFVNKRADALRIVVSDARDFNNPVPVNPNREFKAGDQLKVYLWSNFEGYVYLVNIEPSGRKCLLLPSKDLPENKVVPGRKYEFPGSGAIQFDEEKGTEVLQVITSANRIAYLDQAIDNPEGCLGESAASVAEELADDKKKTSTPDRGGITAEQVAQVVPKTEQGGIRSRDVRIAAGKDKDPEGSVVAISDAKGKGGRLKPGEAVVFEIRLKHN